MQAQMNEIAKRVMPVDEILDLSFNFLDHPLTTVASISKAILKKIISAAETKDKEAIVRDLQQRAQVKGGYKSRFLALNLMIDYIEPYTYLAEHQDAVKEIIESTLDIGNNGKYVLVFFETILKKALVRSSPEAEKRWFDIWINEYLLALRSPNETLREAVCTNITPIVIKLNKNSLPLILATLLSADEGRMSMQVLEQVLTLLKIARLNKMLVIDDDESIEIPSIRLETRCQEALHDLRPELPEFSIPQSVLMRLALSEDFNTALSCVEIVAAETKQSLAVTKFELELCSKFVKHSLRTTFPEFRQKYIKAVKLFFIRVRTAYDKDFRKYVGGADQVKNDSVEQAITFLKDILSFIEENLYLDKPVEGALPYFELLKVIFELFGDFEYKLRISQIYPACSLLSKIGYFSSESKSLFIFLVNSMKSTWGQVRVHAYTILTRFPDDYPLLNDPVFVNSVLMTAATELANNPKAMMAEASALFHNLLFKKCLKHLSFMPVTTCQSTLQIAFLRNILGHLQQRVITFQVALIKEGKKEALLHGYLSFFKHLFEDFKIEISNTEQKEEFLQWRLFVKDLIRTSMQIGQVCKGLLGNNGLLDSNEDGIGEIKVDCRGHPINMDGGDNDIEDYENFILVGVWLAVKENGITQFNLLKWLEFPTSREDDTKLIEEEDIIHMQDNFLDLLFNFKHRGAIEKAADTYSLFCLKLLQSKDLHFNSLPGHMLDRALEKITTENLSTTLRRSAGIPPTIISILRAEPISSEPVLLNKTITFLLNVARTADKDDAKIHALNIMRFIFQDSMLRHDIQGFITPAMILATESFSSNNWSIRNSALMAFSSLTKRLLNNLNVQEQDLSRTRGLAVWEFLYKYHDLSEFFLVKLREGLEPVKKEEKEKADLVIFSILLMISRLVPSFQFVEFEQKQEKTREASIQEYVALIKAYSGNATYFVRKIAAQAILPLIKFEEYVTVEIPSYFEELIHSLKNKRLRQNQAHGLMVRINVFLSAYFKYRDVTSKQLGPGHHVDVVSHRESEETILAQCFERFEAVFAQVQSVYSKVTVGLFVKTYTKLIANLPHYEPKQEICQTYKVRFEDITKKWVVQSSEEVKEPVLMSGDEQILLQEISRLLTVLSLRQPVEEQKKEELLSVEIFSAIVTNFTERYSDFVYTYLGYFQRELKKADANQQLMSSLSAYLSKIAIPSMLSRDEKFCKVTEMLLKISHNVVKIQREAHILPEPSTIALQTEALYTLMTRFSVNPSILSQVIKLLAYSVLNAKDLAINGQMSGESYDQLFLKVTSILAEFSPMQHKELVRIAVSKSLAKLLPLLTKEGVTIGNELKRFPGQLAMLFSLVILLNDEQPDIRYYLCESESLTHVIDHKNSSQWKILDDSYVVRLNDQIVVELLFEDFTQQCLSNSDFLKLYSEDFLFQQWIMGNPYRDHLSKNYEEKIFFFEPLNKFYDLLWVKRLAFKQLLMLAKNGHQVHISEVIEQSEVEAKLKRYYAPENILMHNSTELEAIAQEIMIFRIAKPEVVLSVPKECEQFLMSLIA